MKKIRTYIQTQLAAIRSGFHISPARDWGILFTLALILTVASTAWNAWIFYQTVNGVPIGTSSADSIDANLPSASKVTAIQDVFKARAAEESNYQNSYQFVDPSVQGS